MGKVNTLMSFSIISFISGIHQLVAHSERTPSLATPHPTTSLSPAGWSYRYIYICIYIYTYIYRDICTYLCIHMNRPLYLSLDSRWATGFVQLDSPLSVSLSRYLSFSLHPFLSFSLSPSTSLYLVFYKTHTHVTKTTMCIRHAFRA
jgi:hypothetical protein